MKKTFFEYYKWTEEEISNFWKNSFFTFDTNILLDSFRLSQELSDLLFSVLSKLKDRIILTNQVALEYHGNIDSVLEQELKKYDESLNLLKKLDESLSSQRGHPFIKNYKTSLNTIRKKLDSSKEKFSSEIKNHPYKLKLCDIFCEKVQQQFSKDELDDIYREGEERYKQKIPPGYKDINKSNNNNKYNDLIIWKEIIKYAAKQKKDIIFVTNDKKEDWFFKENPRRELIREFWDKTSGNYIHIIDLNTFIHEADVFLDSQIGNPSLKKLSSAISFIQEEKKLSSDVFITDDLLQTNFTPALNLTVQDVFGEVQNNSLILDDKTSTTL